MGEVEFTNLGICCSTTKCVRQETGLKVDTDLDTWATPSIFALKTWLKCCLRSGNLSTSKELVL